MSGPKTRFHSALEAKIAEQRNLLLESMGSGACQDYAHYRNICGMIAGFEQVLNLCDEIEREFN